MATSEHRAIAEAVKDGLNAQIAGLGATRVYKQDIAREDLTGLTVLVVPATHKAEPINRAQNRHTYAVDIGVFRPIDDIESEAEIDAGMDDVEAILELFDENGSLRHQTMNGAEWEAIANDPAWDPEHLDKAVFASRITLTYSGRK